MKKKILENLVTMEDMTNVLGVTRQNINKDYVNNSNHKSQARIKAVAFGVFAISNGLDEKDMELAAQIIKTIKEANSEDGR